MAEPIGLAVGFIGLAGLFSTCVDCFKLVQVYNSRSSDYESLQTMLDNQQFHFMAWGRACGFMDAERVNTRFDDPLSRERNVRIETTMEKIQSLLMSGDNLRKQYGLKVHRAPFGSKMIEPPGLSAFSKTFQSTKAFWNTSLQRKSHISGTIRWAVNDKEKFSSLVQNLRDLIADLTKMTEDFGVAVSQRLVVEYEMELIDDEPSLEVIAAASACDDDDDLVSHAVSRRLHKVKAQSVANRSVGFDDSVSAVSIGRYTPSVDIITEEEMEGIVQEIGITRVPLPQWRNVKTRAGIVPWLKTLLVATSPPPSVPDGEDNSPTFSRTNTLDIDESMEATTCEGPVRLAINSRTLINVLRTITGFRFSSQQNVIIYPFKPLLTYETELRRHHSRAETRLQSLLVAQVSSAVDDPGAEIEADSARQEGSDQQFPNVSEVEKAQRLVSEMQCLIDFIDLDLQHLLTIKREVKKRNLQTISFEHLWICFQPGDFVVSSRDGSDDRMRAYQILHVTGGRPILDIENNADSETVGNEDSWTPRDRDVYAFMSSRVCTEFSIDCFYIDFDGTKYGPRPERFTITEFSGKQDMLSLPIYPLQQANISQTQMERLLERGRRFVAIKNLGHYEYQGSVLQEWDYGHRERCEICSRTSKLEQISGGVIIDQAEAIEYCKTSGCNWTPAFGGHVIRSPTRSQRREVFEMVDCSLPNCKTCSDVFDDAAIDRSLRDKFVRSSRSFRALLGRNLAEDQLILLPYRICGFSIRNRKWYALDCNYLRAAETSSVGLNNLVIPPQHKMALAALIKAESSETQSNDIDVVKNKRQGMLILLHGAPGVGKTSTAETLAVSLNRPLLTINLADIGTTPKELAENLIQTFRQSERWNCILLLRNADAILRARERSDRESYHISSVFLEQLEYLSGILIMMTSRVGDFDEATASRIHIALFFPALDKKATLKIWELSLRSRQESDPRCMIDTETIMEFVDNEYTSGRLRWNGRQIRNGIATAAALAQESAQACGIEKYAMTTDHIKTVAQTSQEFDSYMGEIRPTSDDMWRRKSKAPTVYPTVYHTNDITLPSKIEHAPFGDSDNDKDMMKDEQGDDDFKIQNLELQLKMAKLKQQQKALQAKRARNPSQRLPWR